MELASGRVAYRLRSGTVCGPWFPMACGNTVPLGGHVRLSRQPRIWTQERAERRRHGPLARCAQLHLAAAASASGSSTASSTSTSGGRDTLSTGHEQDLSGYTPRKGRNSRQGDGGEKRKEGRGPKRRGPPKKEHKGRAAEAEEASYLSPAKYTAMAEAAADEKLLFERVPARPDAIYCVYAYPNEYAVGITRLAYICTAT